MADDIRNTPEEPTYGRPRHERAAREPRAGGMYAPEEEGAEAFFPPVIRRISWGAIFAGAFIALVVQLLLNLFGLAIGLGSIDPAAEQNPLTGLGVGTGIWLAISAIIALFAGGWAAAHFAGLPRRIDGILHGIVSWAVAMFITFYLIASGLGAVLGGAFNLVQGGTQFLAQGVEAVAPGASVSDLAQTTIRQEGFNILRENGQENLLPENLAQNADQPAVAERVITNSVNRLIAVGPDEVTVTEQQTVAAVLMNQANMSQQEANQAIQQYEQAFQQAEQQMLQTGQQTGQQIQQQAAETAGQVASAASSAAFWTAIAMLLGAAAAAAGGAFGAPSEPATVPVVRRE